MNLLKYFSPQARAQLQVLLWTLGLIAGLTAFNFLFILHRVGPGLSIDSLPVSINRDLASLSSVGVSQKALKTPVINFSCKKQKLLKNLRTLAPTTRVRLDGCPEDISVVNTANASKGELFVINKKLQTSDFLPLIVGKNEILVKYGEKSIKLMIIRDKNELHGTANSKRPSS